MHILHIDTEKTWRGGENQVRLLVEGLKQKGISTSIATPPKSALAKKLSSSQKIFEVPMRGGVDLVAAYKIADFCKKNKVTIIDCQSSNAHSIGLLCKKFFLPQIKIVVHRRVDFIPQSGLFNKYKYLNKNVDCYVAISHAIEQILVEFGIEKGRVKNVPSAVDRRIYDHINKSQERKKWLDRLRLDSKTVLIGQAAAMTHQKGYETLLESLRLLKNQNLKFHCAIAGDGELKNSLVHLTEKLQLQNEITFLGWIDDIPSFLSSLDIFAMPSRFEGLGTVALEAVYAGCCLVTTNVGGLREIVIDQETGLQSPLDCAKAFCDNLSLSIRNENLRSKLNERAKIHCEEKFSLENMINGNYQIYQNLMNN